MSSEKEYISLFRTLVAEKFLAGNSDGKLRQRDFEYLTRLIEEKSNIRISLSTIKRLWKNDYSQEPHPATLDALASILGFADWQSFKKANSENITSAPLENRAPKKKQFAWVVVAGLGTVLTLIGFLVLQGFNRSEKKLTLPHKIPFATDKTVSAGVPNTVIFHYDLKDVVADSFFIQQSWNPRNKVSIDPAKSYLSSIYYTPGFHRAKLIVNDSIVSTSRIHITTEGWMPIVQYDLRDNAPFYLDKKSIVNNGVMHTPLNVFENSNIDLSKKFYLRYYNVREYEEMNSDNFSIETRLKHDSIGNVICPLAELTILTEEHIFYIPVTNKGCVGELQLKMGEIYQSGRDNDLSGLGANVYDWQVLRIENRKKNATIFLNDKQATEIRYNRDFGRVVGIIYTFNGPGSVDYLRIKNLDGEMIYKNEFDQQRLP